MPQPPKGRPGFYRCVHCHDGNCLVIGSDSTYLRGMRGKSDHLPKSLRTVRRRRECTNCHQRFTTYEIPQKQYSLYLAFLRAVTVQAELKERPLTEMDDRQLRALLFRALKEMKR